MGKITGFREYKREDPEKRGVEERVKDYREIYCGLSEDKIKIQAARCMNCGTPLQLGLSYRKCNPGLE